MAERIENKSIFDRYPYDDGAVRKVYEEARECHIIDNDILLIKGNCNRIWYFHIPDELRESVKKAPRPERLIFLYELLHRGLVMFRDGGNYHIGTMNSEIIKRLALGVQSDDTCTDGCCFFDLAQGWSRKDIWPLSPENGFFKRFDSCWELEIFFDYDI